MKRRPEELIGVLERSDRPLPSALIAQMLGVTSRSIKNYVARLNEEHPGLIIASARGYMLGRAVQTELPECSDVPQTYAERRQHIIHHFFVDHDESVDVYDLCDELCLSYSSVKNLMSKMNQEYQSLRVAFRTHGDRIFLEGNERDKRRFLTRAIYRESSGCFVDRKAMKRLFDSDTVDTIDEVLKEVAGSRSLSLSEFGYSNLLLHLAIAVDRVRSGNGLGAACDEAKARCEKTAVEIIDSLNERLGIDFDEMECAAIDEQVRMNLLPNPMNEKRRLIEDIGERNYRVTAQIIDAVNRRYHLHLNADTLLLPLALHIKNLVVRCRRGAVLPNPFLETMQSSCPVLFDCAISAAEILQKEFGVQIPKDEIAFIAMHVGADIERQNREDGKLACVLLCPDYHNSREEIAAYLRDSLSAQITLIAACGSEDEIPEVSFDILFTTVSPASAYGETVIIPPLKSALDLRGIIGRLQDIADRRKLRAVSESYRTFFRPEFFKHLDGPGGRRDEVIRDLAHLLMDAGYVSADYLEDVMRREDAASTAFRDVAIPHAMNVDARRTGIALAIAPGGVEWGDRRVHAVLLMAISEQDLSRFQELYEALILLFSQDGFVRKLQGCTQFEQFTQLLLSYAG